MKESFIKNSPSSNRTKEVVSLKRKASTKQMSSFEIESKKKVKKLTHGQSAGTAADANFTTEKIADPIKDIISNRRKNPTPNHIMTEIKSKHTQQEPKVQVVDTLVLSSNKKRIDDKFPKVAIADCAPGGISNFDQKPSQGSIKLTSNATVADASGSLGGFDQAFARKKQAEKVKKVLEKQKRKAEAGAGTTKKYRGFGEKFDPEEEMMKKKIKKEKKRKSKELVIKKAQVTKAEGDLMKELLNFAETAVADALTPIENKVAPVEVATKSSVDAIDASSVFDFEEFQILGDSFTADSKISEDLESLFELN